MRMMLNISQHLSYKPHNDPKSPFNAEFVGMHNLCVAYMSVQVFLSMMNTLRYWVNVLRFRMLDASYSISKPSTWVRSLARDYSTHAHSLEELEFLCSKHFLTSHVLQMPLFGCCVVLNSSYSTKDLNTIAANRWCTLLGAYGDEIISFIRAIDTIYSIKEVNCAVVREDY